MVDRNKKAVNKAKFEAVTDEIAKQEYVDYTKSEMINTGFAIAARNLELQQMEAVIEIKESQIVADKIEEEMNGMPKTKRLVIAEYNALRHEFNLKIAEYNKLGERLSKEFKLSNEDIHNLAIGKFNYKFWKDEQVIKDD